jgi:formate dehydrogenase iron-sulfur subunit
MSLRIFIPRDAGAIAVGADGIAWHFEQSAARRGLAVEIVRTG